MKSQETINKKMLLLSTGSFFRFHRHKSASQNTTVLLPWLSSTIIIHHMHFFVSVRLADQMELRWSFRDGNAAHSECNREKRNHFKMNLGRLWCCSKTLTLCLLSWSHNLFSDSNSQCGLLSNKISIHNSEKRSCRFKGKKILFREQGAP